MKTIKEALVLSLCLSLIFTPTVVMAAPQGGKVVGGSASIHQSGANTTINQSSDRAVINWNSFDIGKHEAVRHNMPSSSSAALHRVVGGGGASQIQGLLQSNGNIYLVNPAGVVIHKGAKVDTNGFIATTRDISDSNFMQGKMVFDKPGLVGAQILNQGKITVKESGLAALVAPSVRNEGLIAAKLGKVALASGEGSWSLDMHGDDLITFTVDENAVNSLHGADGKPLNVENSGSIKAEGGVVVLTAAQLDGIVGSVVNSGEISAASAEVSGGMITFRGQGSGVNVINTGKVDVSSAVADGGTVRMDTDGKLSSSGSIAATGGKKGGKVTLTGKSVALKGSAKIDASGKTGGGTVLVGGNALGKGPERNAKITKMESGAAIHADAKVKGDGGQVVVWSDEKTTFDGTITTRGGKDGGNGGQVETSGKSLKIGEMAQVETLAPKGLYGEWLLDPEDFIVAIDGDISGKTISDNLTKGNVTLNSFAGKQSGSGNIIIKDNIAWKAATRLTCDAYNDIIIYSRVDIAGDGASLNIRHGNSGLYKLNGGIVTFYGKNQRLFIGGEEYTLIRDIYDLQNMNINLNGRYALANDIDATSTLFWNNGMGFAPIGRHINAAFSGRFEGNGNTIQNIYINRPSENYIGLFGYTQDVPAVISNIFVKDAFISGNKFVGILSGCNGNEWLKGNIGDVNAATIYNSFVSGEVHGQEQVGGLVGLNHGIIFQASANATVTGYKWIGGLAGANRQYISDCYSTGNVSGHKNIGGLVGLHVDNRLQPSGTGNGIFNSYSTGFVSGVEEVGGLVGGSDIFYPPRTKNSFWNINTSGQNYSYSGTGLTTEQMNNNSSFAMWDFNNTWTIDKNENFPQLQTIIRHNYNLLLSPIYPTHKNINYNKEGLFSASQQNWIADINSSNYNDSLNNKYLEYFLFHNNELNFQKAKEIIHNQEFLRDASLFTLAGRTAEIFCTKLIASATKEMSKDLIVTTLNPAAGVVNGFFDILSKLFLSKAEIKKFITEVMNSKEIENMIKNTILTFILTYISKQEYLHASSLENTNLNKRTYTSILNHMYKSYAYNAIATQSSVYAIKYYKDKEILNNYSFITRSIYNTLDMITNVSKEIVPTISNTVEKGIISITNELTNSIISEIIPEYNDILADRDWQSIDFYSIMKKSMNNISISNDDNTINITINIENTKIYKSIDFLYSNFNLYTDTIIDDNNVQHILNKLEGINSI